MDSLTRWFRGRWLAITGRGDDATNHPAVIIHDPAAQGPRDLDDPFFDPAVQSRMGEIIAKTTSKKDAQPDKP